MSDRQENNSPDLLLVLICSFLHFCAFLFILWLIPTVAEIFGWTIQSSEDFGEGLGIAMVAILTTPLFGFLWATLVFKYLNSDGSGFTRDGLCHVCGYDVRAASSSRCSECGAVIGVRSLSRLERLHIQREKWSNWFSKAAPRIVLGVMLVVILAVLIHEMQL